MTIFLWDASHYDAVPTARDGIDGYVHKAREGHGFYTDPEYAAAMSAARNLGIPVLGAYFVLHPGTAADQVDFLLELVESATPWWREVPWIWQIDAEKFDYMSRAPSIAEINAFGDELCRRTGSPASSVFAYAPKWLYGDQVSGLRYAIWASNYGSNPAGHYPDIYPGDGSSRWAAYGGKTPAILQYGSRATIAGQLTCDANGFRGSLDDLLALTTKGGDMEQTEKLIRDTGNPNRTVGDHFYDVQNERNWWYAKPGDVTVNPPPAGSRADQLLKDVAAIKSATAQILAALGSAAPGGGATVAEVQEIVHGELGKLEITVKD